jgi:uncharacterized protein (DUF2461 family)
MATLLVTRWKESPAWSAWAPHARSELRRRLRKAINLSPAALKQVSRQIKERQTLVLSELRENEVEGVRHILQAMGAVVERRD